jgi:hypothetical protein
MRLRWMLSTGDYDALVHWLTHLCPHLIIVGCCPQRHICGRAEDGGDPVTATLSVPAGVLHSGSNTVAESAVSGRQRDGMWLDAFAALRPEPEPSEHRPPDRL